MDAAVGTAVVVVVVVVVAAAAVVVVVVVAGQSALVAVLRFALVDLVRPKSWMGFRILLRLLLLLLPWNPTNYRLCSIVVDTFELYEPPVSWWDEC